MFVKVVPCGVADPRYGVTSLADLGHPDGRPRHQCAFVTRGLGLAPVELAGTIGFGAIARVELGEELRDATRLLGAMALGARAQETLSDSDSHHRNTHSDREEADQQEVEGDGHRP